MSKRLIDSSIWSNESFANLPAHGRLLLLGMLNHADDQGRIKAHPAYLRSIIFPYDDIQINETDEWLHQLQDNETIILYEVNGKKLAQFVNWWDYQRLQYARPSRYTPPDGWTDRIRTGAGQGRSPLTYNWTTPSGHRIPDTCNSDGIPLDNFTGASAGQVEGNLGASCSQVVGDLQLGLQPNLNKTNLNKTNLNKDDEENALVVVVKAYEAGIGLVSQAISERLIDAVDEYPVEWITDAIDIAVDAQKLRWDYVAAILRRCREEGHPPKRGGKKNKNGDKGYDIPDEYSDIIIG